MSDDSPESLGDDPTYVGKAKEREEQSLGDQSTYAGSNESSLSDLDGLGGDLEDGLAGLEIVDLESRYTIIRPIGKGGMGEVFLATDTRLNRKVAIKRIKDELTTPAAAARFLTEAKSIAALSHPYIVQVYDYGRAKDGPFLIMEYVEGENLQQVCNQGVMALEDAVDLSCKLCDALGTAHSKGIIHRDIKPANILMTSGGWPKISDFGLAKSSNDRGHTMTGTALGTLDFMPPEQRRDASAVDHRSDLWSLAATIYQMVTGESPKVIDLDNVPDSLRPVLAKALKSNPASRYSSLDKFSKALTECLSLQSLNIFIKAQTCLGDYDLKHASELMRQIPSRLQTNQMRSFSEQVENNLKEYGRLKNEIRRLVKQGDCWESNRFAQMVERAIELCGIKRSQQNGLDKLKRKLANRTGNQSEGLSTLTSSKPGEAVADIGSSLEPAGNFEETKKTALFTLGVLALGLTPVLILFFYLTYDPAVAEKNDSNVAGNQVMETFVIEQALKDGDWETVLSLDSDNSAGLNLKRSADIKQAITAGDYQRVLVLEPDNATGLKMKTEADIAIALGNGDWKTVLQLDPENPTALGLKRTADINTAIAAGNYEQVLNLDPDNRTGLKMKIEADIAKALGEGDWETVLKLDSDNPIALASKKASDLKHALDLGDFVLALEIAPENPEARKLKQTRIDELLKSGDFENVLLVDPDNASALSLKKKVFQESISRRDYPTALNLDPGNKEVLENWKAEIESKCFLIDSGAAIHSLLFASDKKTFLSAGAGGNIKLWDAKNGTELVSYGDDSDDIFGMALAKDGKTLATAAGEAGLKFWNVRTGDEVSDFFNTNYKGVYCVDFCSDNEGVVVGGYQRVLEIRRGSVNSKKILIDPVTGEASPETKDKMNVYRGGHNSYVYCVSVSPDKSRVASGGLKFVKIWGQPVHLCDQHVSRVYSVEFSPTGDKVVSASQDGTVRVWNTNSGVQEICFDGHEGPVRC
ncbi:protein kinase, partial [Mariniblastus sp.]|nr:protein kinase [Mariniblastus sp.]